MLNKVVAINLIKKIENELGIQVDFYIDGSSNYNVKLSGKTLFVFLPEKANIHAISSYLRRELVNISASSGKELAGYFDHLLHRFFTKELETNINRQLKEAHTRLGRETSNVKTVITKTRSPDRVRFGFMLRRSTSSRDSHSHSMLLLNPHNLNRPNIRMVLELNLLSALDAQKGFDLNNSNKDGFLRFAFSDSTPSDIKKFFLDFICKDEEAFLRLAVAIDTLSFEDYFYYLLKLFNQFLITRE